MWYFAWILGAGLALLFGVLNAMWFELRASDRDRARRASGPLSNCLDVRHKPGGRPRL